MTSFANNAFKNSTEEPIVLFEGYSDQLLTFASVTCILFIVVGVPGNLLTIIALSRGKQTRRSTAVFIINLSLSDLLFGCFNLPLSASTFMQRSWSHGDLLCRLFPLLRYGLLAVSLFTVSLITVNRYVIIAHPRKYQRIYQRRYLALMVGFSWIMAFCIMIPTWQEVWGRFGLDVEIGSCTILPDENGHSPKEFLFVIAFALPCICIVFCYARIFYLVRKAASRTREPAAKNINNRAFDERIALQQQRVQALINEHKQRSLVGVEQQKIEQVTQNRPFFVDLDDIEYIDVSDSNDDAMPISYTNGKNKSNISKVISTPKEEENNLEKLNHENFICKEIAQIIHEKLEAHANNSNPLITTSKTRFQSRKGNYVAIGNTSNASAIYPGRMSVKDRRLLKMILVIFIWFLVCYLPITITKIWKGANDIHFFNISGYLLIYLTTCINPLIYVLMSSEYRRAYWRLLSCRSDPQNKVEAARKNKS